MHKTEPTSSFAGLSLVVLQGGGETQGRYTLIEVHAPADHVTFVHEHFHDRETSYVLDGLLRVQTRDGVRRLRAGEAATVERGTPHRLANRSGTETRFLQICRPAGRETLLHERGDPIADPAASPLPMSDPPLAQLERGAPERGMRLLPDDALPSLDEAPAVAGTGPSSFDLIGIDIDVIETGGDEHDDLALVRAVFQPGTVVPLHGHREPETFYVLSGRLDVYREGPDAGWTEAGAGDVVAVAAHRRHAVRNAGQAPCVALTLAQRRLLQFSQAGTRPAGAPKEPPSPLERRAVFEVGHRFGFWNGSPADNEAIGLTL